MNASNHHSPGFFKRCAVSFTAVGLLLLLASPSLYGEDVKGDRVEVPLEHRAILAAGRAAAARGDLKVAIERFQEYLSLYPKDNQARAEYAAVLVRDEEWTQAIAQYDLLIEHLPDDASYRVGIANVHLQLGQGKLAIPHLLAALKASEHDTEIASLLARAYLGFRDPQNAPLVFDRVPPTAQATDAKIRGSFEESEVVGQPAISNSTNPPNATVAAHPVSATQDVKGDQVEVPPEQRAILGAGRAAAARGDLKVAIGRFQEYLSLNPKDTKVRHEFTGLLVRAKEWKQAIAQYDLLIQALPDDTSIRIGVANVYLQLRQPRLAIPHLLAALKASPQDTEVATQLARAYLGFGELQNARLVFDRLLSGVRPTDAKIPARFARLLLDLNRPRQALPFLKELILQNPNDNELRSESIIANAWLGNYDEATALIADFASIEPDNTKLRVDLGDWLYRLREFKLARLVYDQALRVGNNPRATLGLARVEIQMYNIEAAAKLIEASDTDTAPPALLALVRGELHLAVGTYAEAIHALRSYLEVDEDDIDCRAALAKVYETTTDYEKAKAEWAKLAQLRGESVRGTSGVALILGLQRLFMESNALCNFVLAEEPDSAQATAQLIYNFGKMKQVDNAYELGQTYINGTHEHDNGVVYVGLALGRALLEAGRFEDALAVYETIATRPHGDVPATHFGRYYAMAHLDRAAEGRRFLLVDLKGSLRDRIELADMAAVFNVNDLVIELCNSVLATYPYHLPALLRRGQAELRVAAFDANISAAVNTANMILKISPTNIAGRLTLARAYPIVRDFGHAFLEYDKLIKTDPNLMQVRKELARTMFTANAYGASNAQYAVGQYPSAEEVLHDALYYLAHPPEAAVQSPHAPPPAWSPIALPSSSAPFAAAPQEVKKWSPSNPLLAAFSPTPVATSAWTILPLRSAAPAPNSRTSPLLEVAVGSTNSTTAHGQSAATGLIGPRVGPTGLEDVKPLSPQEVIAVSAQVSAQPEPLQAPRKVAIGEAGQPESGALPKDAAELEAESQRKQKRQAIDVETRAAEIKALQQEQYAMSRKDLRYHEAVGAFGGVVASQPDNISAMFSLAEMYGALGLTRAAIGTTNELLAADPFNRDAAVMLDWATMTLQPRARGQIDLSTQQGRNGLTSVERDKYTIQGICPFGDEGDYVGLGYSRVVYVPRGYSVLAGDMPTLLFGKQISDSMKFVSETNFEAYPHGFSDRPTFNASLTCDINDCWQANLGGYLRNVADNGASIMQDIFRGGAEIGSTFHITRELDAEASYRLSGYSDSNLEHEALARFSYRLTPAPCELKFISSVQFTSFDETNFLSGTNSPELPRNVVPPDFTHPYFAPLCFFYFEERLAYKQTLSRDLFKYADHCYVQLEYGLGVDNRETIYHNFRAGLNYDVNLWLRLGVNVDATVSSVYKSGAGVAFIELRWPAH